MGQRRTPGVEHSGNANARAQMFGVSRDDLHGLRRGAEQEVVDQCLVLEGDDADLSRKREHNMEIADWQQVGFALG